MAAAEQVMTVERLDAFTAAWDAHDVEAIVASFTDDGEFHASVGPDLLGVSYVGRDEVRRGVVAFFARFPDGRFEDASSWVAGDRGVAEWTFVAGGAAVRGCDLFEFEGTRIRVKNAFRKHRPA